MRKRVVKFGYGLSLDPAKMRRVAEMGGLFTQAGRIVTVSRSGVTGPVLDSEKPPDGDRGR
jgi:hypothetical protein